MTVNKLPGDYQRSLSTNPLKNKTFEKKFHESTSFIYLKILREFENEFGIEIFDFDGSTSEFLTRCD